MNRTTVAASLCAGVLALGPVACDGSQAGPFPVGSTMDRLNKAGKITVGVKFDQPGLGFRNPATRKLEGFDIEMAEIVAAGLKPGQIDYVEAVTEKREELLMSDRVDIVLASYSITDEHRQDIGQAGPYYVTGQQILVREEDKDKITGPDKLSGVKVCSVTGSTSIKRWRKQYKAPTIERKTYTECVRQLLRESVGAVTTDGAILLGYEAKQPHNLEVVGKPFSEERYGIGYQKGDLAFCQFLTATIKNAQRNGDLEEAFEDTLGKAGAQPPENPPPDPCPV